MYQKTLFHTLFGLFLKLLKAPSVSRMSVKKCYKSIFENGFMAVKINRIIVLEFSDCSEVGG